MKKLWTDHMMTYSTYAQRNPATLPTLAARHSSRLHPLPTLTLPPHSLAPRPEQAAPRRSSLRVKAPSAGGTRKTAPTSGTHQPLEELLPLEEDCHASARQ